MSDPCCSVATVFKAVCIATSMKVIIKAYYKQKMHPKHFHKLHREIQAMKALNGPYVAEFFSTFEDTQCVYIIMEFCEGGDLFKTMLMHGGLLDEQWVCVEVSSHDSHRETGLLSLRPVHARSRARSADPAYQTGRCNCTVQWVAFGMLLCSCCSSSYIFHSRHG